MIIETQVRLAEATTHQNLAKKPPGVHVLTDESSAARLFGQNGEPGEGAFGWLVHSQRAPDFQPPPPQPLEHWPFFYGELSSDNTREDVHLHVWAPELYKVEEGRLLVHTWDGSKWVTTALGPHEVAVVNPLTWHYVEWDESYGRGRACCVKAPHDPTVPGAKIVAPKVAPLTLNGNGHTSVASAV